MIQFWYGDSSLPDEYLEAYLCLTLNITYTELCVQPAEWVEQMLDMLKAKSKAEEHKSKVSGGFGSPVKR